MASLLSGVVRGVWILVTGAVALVLMAAGYRRKYLHEQRPWDPPGLGGWIKR